MNPRPAPPHRPKDPPVVRVSDLHLSFGGQRVLQGVHLEIQRGQLVALIGPNGSGKTTLLRCLLGLERPDAGEVALFGETDLRRALPRVGYVPQRFVLEAGFSMSVREFLALRLEATRHWFWQSHRQADRAFAPVAADLGVEPLLDRPIAKLSGGQIQRVLIAFSLLRKPELLLLDEPTAGVDAPGEHTFYDLIARIQQQYHLTAVLVSHDLSMVYRHATWVYALNQVICCEGPPDQVINTESLSRAYGVHASPYSHHHHAH
jgi:zinc transport system ATP-binding protein